MLKANKFLTVIALFLFVVGMVNCGYGGDGSSRNTSPAANAGTDQNVLTGLLVTLDGSGSSDTDGDLLIYNWSFVSVPAGSAAVLSDPTVVNPTFTVDTDGLYVINLVVNDGTVDSAADTVTVVMATDTTTYFYTTTDAIFPNPERGFYDYRNTAITQQCIQSLRAQAVTVIRRIYNMPEFIGGPLSQEFLNQVESDLDQARIGGVKVMLLFSYTILIDGPDAPLDIILLHIDQLKPILQANYDVIAFLEAGFIGAWGEWFYSTNNLTDTFSRRAVLFSLLSALPPSRAVVIRRPAYKINIFENPNPLSLNSAFDGSYRARTGALNDAFLSDATDMGTYRWDMIEQDKIFLNLDNRFVPQGGESNQPSIYSGGANALVELARMRWSLLNQEFHLTVLDGWVADGSMPEIKRRLGYRLQLVQATLQNSVRPGGSFSFNFEIVNNGFASPFNPRNLRVILRNNQTGEKYFLLSEADPRFWMAGETVNINIEGGIPENMPQGSYEVLLHLSDPSPRLRDRPEFSIRLANTGIWEDLTGFNSLLHNVVIDNNAGGATYTGTHFFRPVGVYDNTPPVITLSGINPQSIPVGSPYIELGARVWDDVDGNIIGSIVIDTSAVNTNMVGTYTVTYNISDAAGNPATQVTRTVNVVAVADTIAPSF